MARLLFFGALSDAMGREQELQLPQHVLTVGELIGYVAGLEPAFGSAIGGMTVRVAVNEKLVDLDAAVVDSDAIAFLPPYSGG